MLVLLLTACGDSGDIIPPTIMQFPTLPPTNTLPPTPTPTLTPSATDTPAATFTPSLTPSPTATETPTATHTPSITPTPSPTATLTPVKIIVQSEVGAFVRSGPDVIYPVAGVVTHDETFDAVAFAVNSVGDVWYLIELTNGTPAWISQYVAARGDDAPLGQIAQAATIPASPTPSPTLTPTPTYTPSLTPTLPPGANARIYDDSRVNLRAGPGTNFSALGLMEPGAPLALIGRNTASTWVNVNTFDGRSGWVFRELVVVLNINIAALRVTWTEPTAVVVAPPAGGGRVGTGSGSLITGSTLANVRSIYARGQQRGNRPNSFIVVGDSVSARSPEWSPFFAAFGRGNYSLGAYGYLQPTVDFFQPSGSFGVDFQTARAGFATHFILDPVWADPAVCAPGETPLACEYRTRKPATAILYLGLMDMQISTIGAFQQNLDTIVRSLIDWGVIPILNTSTLANGSEIKQRFGADMDQINSIVRQMAARYQVPLMDFQQASYSLPNQGCLQDGAHLSYRIDGYTEFNGDERIYGKDLRELLTLQYLDELRNHVFGG
jgi:uncharacterized protein YgiM (DUF1202 family)